MVSHITGCLVAVFCAADAATAEGASASTAKMAYQRLLLAEHWRERGEAVRQLEAFGEQALPSLIRGTKHGWEEIRETCYQSLFEKFPDREETAQAVVRGLADRSSKVQYSCAFFAGTQKIAAAESRLRKIFEDHSHDLRLTAAKSLAQLGHADVILVVYQKASNDRYMHRYQANLGLKALSGRDLSDFGDYDWGEGAYVSHGNEVFMMLRPIKDAAIRAQRYHALAEFCRWLQPERPELYRHLDPHAQGEG